MLILYLPAHWPSQVPTSTVVSYLELEKNVFKLVYRPQQLETFISLRHDVTTATSKGPLLLLWVCISELSGTHETTGPSVEFASYICSIYKTPRCIYMHVRNWLHVLNQISMCTCQHRHSVVARQRLQWPIEKKDHCVTQPCLSICSRTCMHAEPLTKPVVNF